MEKLTKTKSIRFSDGDYKKAKELGIDISKLCRKALSKKIKKLSAE